MGQAPECWTRVLDIQWRMPARAPRRADRPAGGGSRAATRPRDSEADLSLVAAVAAIPATDWFAVARWAKETKNLQPWQRQIAFTIGQCLSKGWDISARQAAQAHRLMEEAQRLGFRPSL